MKFSELVGRKVEFFRAHIEPGILSMPKNALHHTDKDIKLMEITEVGVYVKTIPGYSNVNGQKIPHNGMEFIVPFSNCQTVRLLAEEGVELKHQAPIQVAQQKPASGLPRPQ